MGYEPSPLWPLLTLVVGVPGWVLATRGRRGETVAPFSMLLLVLLSIFAVRPLFMLEYGEYGLYGLNVTGGFNAAAFAGFLAVVFACVGYLVASRRAGAERYPGEAEREVDPPKKYSTYRAVLISAALIGAWFAFMASRGGVAFLFAGRNEDVTAALAGVPAAVGAMPVAGALLVATVRVMTERERRLCLGERLAFWLVILLSVIPPMALGTRRYLLPCLLAGAIATTAAAYRHRVKLQFVLLGFVAFVVLAIVPFVRSTGARGGNTNIVSAIIDYFATNGVIGSLKPYFTSYDTEMFNYVAYLAPRLGDAIPYGFGRGTVGDTLLNPFPASLAPAPLWSDQLLTGLFGGGCAIGVCPVPSVVGVLLYDLALPGVIVGCFAIGVLCRRYPHWLVKVTGARLVFLLGFAAFTPVLARGNTVNVGYIAVSTCVIATVAFWACRGRLRSPVETPDFRHARGPALTGATRR